MTLRKFTFREEVNWEESDNNEVCGWQLYNKHHEQRSGYSGTPS